MAHLVFSSCQLSVNSVLFKASHQSLLRAPFCQVLLTCRMESSQTCSHLKSFNQSYSQWITTQWCSTFRIFHSQSLFTTLYIGYLVGFIFSLSRRPFCFLSTCRPFCFCPHVGHFVLCPVHTHKLGPRLSFTFLTWFRFLFCIYFI